MLNLIYYRFAYGNINSLISDIFSYQSLILILCYLAPLGFLPVFSIWCIPGLFIILECMVSNFYLQHTKIIHYASPAIAYFFTGLIQVIDHPKVMKYINHIAITLCVASMSILFSPITRANNLTVPNELTKSIDQIVDKVPAGVSVTANNILFDHLVNKNKVYIPINGFSGNGIWGYPDKLTDYVILTTKHRLQANWENETLETIGNKYELVIKNNEAQLWKLKE